MSLNKVITKLSPFLEKIVSEGVMPSPNFILSFLPSVELPW